MANNLDSTMNQFNSLLQQSQKAMLCGPDCQKAEAAQTLQQKYLDAQVNLQTAPIQLQQAAKKYITYSQGQAGYDDYLNSELQKKADAIIATLKSSFANSLNSAKILSNTYSTQVINSQYASQIYEKYLTENAALESNLKDNSYDIFTNDRKTYYEDQGIDSLKWWYALFFRLYFLLVIAYIIIFFFSTSNFSIISRLLILLGLIIYPFIAPRIFTFFVHLYYRFVSILPKNAYLHL
jgi:hypothetical protein